MGVFSRFEHIKDDAVTEMCSLSRRIGLPDQHPIPLNKILFTLFRKGYLRTILVEENPRNLQFEAECSLDDGDSSSLRRYHFFKTEDESILNSDSYGGYCDVRPDASIADAFVTLYTITAGSKDSYVYVPCKMKQEVEVPLPDNLNLKLEVVGFPYLEKNRKETMCAQAALLGVVNYWKARSPGSFSSVNSAKEINELAGVPVDRQGGLSASEMAEFFNRVGQDVTFCDYSFRLFDGLGQSHLLTDVYSFIESACPVIACVKTHTTGHALTLVGHTFDKNSWSAMADLGYYGKKHDFYHENTTWIENLIIQDDNFGPYYFFPFRRLPEIITCMIVPVPSPLVKVMPHEATSFAVKQTLYNNDFIESLADQLELTPLFSENQRWYEEFVKHLKPTCGDGLVLRTILRTSQEIVDAYAEHEFLAVTEELLSRSNRYYWMVELSWPDIYCFGECQSGMVLVDAEFAEIKMLHIPGVCVAFADKPYIFIAQKEDAPRAHHKPGFVK